MTNHLTPIAENKLLARLDGFPHPSTEEKLESVARELMTVAAMLRSAELRGEARQGAVIERARRALQAGVAARAPLEAACEPATVAEICERIAGLIQSIPQTDPADGYSASLTMDVGSLRPSRGALEAACRRLRTTSMFRPKIPEVLAAVREAGAIYAAALRAIDELPQQIVHAESARSRSGEYGGYCRAAGQRRRDQQHDGDND
jgi:hypothetical protein